MRRSYKALQAMHRVPALRSFLRVWHLFSNQTGYGQFNSWEQETYED
jgi:hypothetical protein